MASKWACCPNTKVRRTPPCHHNSLLTAPVIHLILKPADGQAQLPYVLQGKAPPSESRNPDADSIATNNYSSPPRAVICGGGYGDDDIASFRKACEGVETKAVWFRTDLTLPTPPVEDKAAYGKHMVARVKAALGKVFESGGLEEKDGFVWF